MAIVSKNGGKTQGDTYLRNSQVKGQTKSAMNDYLSSGGYTNDNSNYGGGGGGYSSGGGGSYAEASNPFGDYLAALQAQRDAAIAEANGLLDEQGRLAEQRYALQKEASDQDYQDLRNQSEVNRYKARGSLRQSLADRGAMDSGIGRQAYVSLANNFDNALNKIGLQQKREDAERNQAINEMWNQIAMSKAANKMMGLDMMGNLMSSIDPSYFTNYSYNPGTSSYYSAANNVVQNTPSVSGMSNIGNAQFDTGATSQARATAFDDLLTALRQRTAGYGSAYGR